METQILSISIITSQGAKTYSVNDIALNGKTIHRIKVATLHFTGDPFDHYVGYSIDGEMIFSINCLCPCEVLYK